MQKYHELCKLKQGGQMNMKNTECNKPSSNMMKVKGLDKEERMKELKQNSKY